MQGGGARFSFALSAALKWAKPSWWSGNSRAMGCESSSFRRPLLQHSIISILVGRYLDPEQLQPTALRGTPSRLDANLDGEASAPLSPLVRHDAPSSLTLGVPLLDVCVRACSVCGLSRAGWQAAIGSGQVIRSERP